MLVCMDEVVTECVYQALVDYNQVGNVDVVGFYYSDVILDGISKGIISSAIALDMDEIGRYSVNAGRVSFLDIPAIITVWVSM